MLGNFIYVNNDKNLCLHSLRQTHILVPTASVTNYHKLSDLKCHKFILFSSGGQK